jgi:hypothetical protein
MFCGGFLYKTGLSRLVFLALRINERRRTTGGFSGEVGKGSRAADVEKAGLLISLQEPSVFQGRQILPVGDLKIIAPVFGPACRSFFKSFFMAKQVALRTVAAQPWRHQHCIASHMPKKLSADPTVCKVWIFARTSRQSPRKLAPSIPSMSSSLGLRTI